MSIERLMEIGPDELAYALLQRRKMLKESLPDVIRTLEAEEESIRPKYEREVEASKRANKKVAVFKEIRDSNQKSANLIIDDVKRLRSELVESGKMVSLDPKWKKEQLFEKIEEIEQKIQTSALDHKLERKMIEQRRALITENDAWLKDRKSSNPEMLEYVEKRRDLGKFFRESDKAHRNMIGSVEKAQPIYERRSSLQMELREVKRQLDRARELLAQADQAITHWERRLSDGFGDLGAGYPDLMKKRAIVIEGGASSFAKQTRKKSRGSKGEEE